MIPKLPSRLHDNGMTDAELSDLWHKLIVELLDTEYAGRTHGSRRTYDAGCKGPLCSKGVREHARRRNSTGPNVRYKFVDPILEFWTPIATERIASAQRKILSELTAS